MFAGRGYLPELPKTPKFPVTKLSPKVNCSAGAVSPYKGNRKHLVDNGGRRW